MRPKSLLIAATAAFAIATGPALAQDSTTRYQQWQGYNSENMQDLINELDELIDQAESDRAADPQFLKDLRGVLAQYSAPSAPKYVALLFDDFRDGNYTQNPTWTVTSGGFRVDRKGAFIGLRSTIYPPGTQQGQTTTGNPALDILGAILNQPAQQTSTAKYAAIYTPVKVSNEFRIKFDFASTERFGRMDFGVYQGSGGSNAYRIAYLPNQKDSLRLLRLTSQGVWVIGAYKTTLSLEDNRRHLIEWTRDKNGVMSVVLDGQEVIRATDKNFTKPFDGFLHLNAGGSYYVRAISIEGRKPQT
ncbi:MAG: hypothetical protein ACKVOI_03850 [Dongiaceae bacterium]